MHQTFYIDIDEEITSIVEKLRNSKSGEVVLVVPKRALLIQSIVNLRLLKKEADSLNVSLSIVTQDNLGKVLVEKAGIFYQESLKETENDEIIRSESRIGESYFDNRDYSKIGDNLHSEEEKMGKIGSDSYFDRSSNLSSEMDKDKKAVFRNVSPEQPSSSSQPSSEKILNKELVLGFGNNANLKKGAVSIDSSLSSYQMHPSQAGLPQAPVQAARNNPPSVSRPSELFPRPIEGVRGNAYAGRSGDRKIDNFFQHGNYSVPAEESKNDFKNASLSRKTFKVFWIFGLILILLVLAAAAYFIVPKADVVITAKGTQKAQEAEVKADAKIETVNYEEKVIPAEAVSTVVTASKSVIPSGNKGASSGKKARGTITIYNEFSSASQSLVATTRFQSEDGKIFRLEKGVTVPGTSKEGGETKAGTIEVEVAADESGESYNISPSKFTIPGFKDSGNGKYEKIYAKSEKAMSGGGSENSSSEGENKKITEADIAGAKSKILSDLQTQVRNKIEESAGEGMVVLDDAINSEEAVYTLSNSAGEAVEKFEIKAQMKVNALVFKKSDLENVIGKIAANSGNGKTSLEGSSMDISYGKADVDFKAETVLIKAIGTIKNGSDIDLENIKKEILGKTNEGLETYLSAYPNIEKVDVTYWPPFMNSKIPLYEKRVNVAIEVE